MGEVNFLCVHHLFRTKKLAPLLIKELTRRINMQDMWQAVYTAGVVIPKPISTCSYYHRNINTRKLIDVGFSSLPAGRKMQHHLKILNIKDQTTMPLRQMKEDDAPGVHKLLTEYLAKFDFSFKYSVKEVRHWFTPRKGVIYSFVSTNADGEITDLISFYSLPSSILKHVERKTLFVRAVLFKVTAGGVFLLQRCDVR